jgi:hypothetical protein
MMAGESVPCEHMTVTIRDFQPGSASAAADAEAAAGVLRTVLPYLVITPRAIRWQSENSPAAQHHRLLLAEVDGQIVASARTGIFYDRSEPGQG